MCLYSSCIWVLCSLYCLYSWLNRCLDFVGVFDEILTRELAPNFNFYKKQQQLGDLNIAVIVPITRILCTVRQWCLVTNYLICTRTLTLGRSSPPHYSLELFVLRTIKMGSLLSGKSWTNDYTLLISWDIICLNSMILWGWRHDTHHRAAMMVWRHHIIMKMTSWLSLLSWSREFMMHDILVIFGRFDKGLTRELHVSSTFNMHDPCLT